MWINQYLTLVQGEHYSEAIMSAMASQITAFPFILTVGSGADQRKTSKLRVTTLCVENSPVTGEFPAQKARNMENVSIWWRLHELDHFVIVL